MGKNIVLRNCKCFVPYGYVGFAAGIFAELNTFGRLSLIRVKRFFGLNTHGRLFGVELIQADPKRKTFLVSFWCSLIKVTKLTFILAVSLRYVTS